MAPLPGEGLVNSLSLSLARSRPFAFHPHLVSTSTAPCTLHLGCSLAGGGGNGCIASCTGNGIVAGLAMVVFGGVARAPLVPPTWPGRLPPPWQPLPARRRLRAKQTAACRECSGCRDLGSLGSGGFEADSLPAWRDCKGGSVAGRPSKAGRHGQL